MSSIDKSLSVEFFKENNDGRICYIGETKSDSDPIITSNIGINFKEPKNQNTIFSHFYTDKASILCIKNIILEKLKINPKLFIENYESDFCEFNIPFSGQCNDGYEIVNTSLNFIPQFPTKLVLKYLQNKLVICFTIDINLPLNSPKYPRFYVYLTMKNQKYGLEYIELSNQSFPQDLVQKGQVNNAGLLKQQINTNELDLMQFFILAGDEKKIRIKIYVTKIYCRESGFI